jgi:hypothetical protein
MIKRLYRKTLPTALAAILSLSSLSFGAYLPLFQRTSDTSTFADGVTHQIVQTFTDQGWINLNVIRVDLSKNLKVVPVTDTYLSGKDTLSNLVQKNPSGSDIVTAINADFFGAATIGSVVKEGQLLTTGVGGDEFASFNVTDSGQAFISYLNGSVNYFTDGYRDYLIDHINKPHLSGDKLIVYDHHWGPESYGNKLGYPIHEVLVVDGVVTEVRRNGLPFQLTEGSYVIAAVGDRIFEIEYRLEVGDQIQLKYDPLLTSLDASIGGGAQLVKEGKVVEKYSQNITGRHPRTGLGISKDRSELILVTVDGRSNSFRGVTQTELAEILIELGAYEAINFDGGGSTQIMGKSPWTGTLNILNYPSDSGERRIFTGLGIEKKLTAFPTLQHVSIKMDQTAMFVGATVALELNAIDTNYDLMGVDPSKIEWSVFGVEGTFNGNAFTPSTAGKGEIQATYNGKKAYKTINVSGDAVKLVVSPAFVELKPSDTVKFSFKVITGTGELVPIQSGMVEALSTDGIGYFDPETGVFTSGMNKTKGIISFKYDGLETYIPVGVGTGEIVLHDFETETGVFSSYPLDVPGSYYEVDGLGLNRSVGAVINYNFTTTDETRAAYLDFLNPKPLPEGTKSIGAWVLGDAGNNHWLRGRVRDVNGVTANITFARNVQWEGYQFVQSELPQNLTWPIVLDRIYLVEVDPTMKDRGAIFIDDITAIVSNASLMEVPPAVDRMKTVLDNPMPAQLKNNPGALVRKAYGLDANEKDRVVYKFEKGIHQFDLVNKAGSIRLNGTDQWTELLALLEKNPRSPMLVAFSDPLKFNDPMEKDLFFELLGKAVDRGTNVLVTVPSSKETMGYDYMNGVKILNVPIAGKGVQVGQLDNILYYEGIK